MYTNPVSVPFEIANVYGGLAECHGLIRAVEDGLQLEFQAKDGIFGVLKSGVKNTLFAWQDLTGLECRLGWFRVRLILTTRSLSVLEGVPGAENCRLDLNVARKDRAVAKSLATAVSLRLLEHDISRLDEFIDTDQSRA